MKYHIVWGTHLYEATEQSIEGAFFQRRDLCDKAVTQVGSHQGLQHRIHKTGISQIVEPGDRTVRSEMKLRT